jgi:hypothetical protein
MRWGRLLYLLLLSATARMAPTGQEEWSRIFIAVQIIGICQMKWDRMIAEKHLSVPHLPVVRRTMVVCIKSNDDGVL